MHSCTCITHGLTTNVSRSQAAPSSSIINAIVSSFVRAGTPIGNGGTPAAFAAALSLNCGSFANCAALSSLLPWPAAVTGARLGGAAGAAGTDGATGAGGRAEPSGSGCVAGALACSRCESVTGTSVVDGVVDCDRTCSNEKYWNAVRRRSFKIQGTRRAARHKRDEFALLR